MDMKDEDFLSDVIKLLYVWIFFNNAAERKIRSFEKKGMVLIPVVSAALNIFLISSFWLFVAKEEEEKKI